MFGELLQNQILLCGCLGWGIAQVLKTIIYAGLNKKWDFRRMFGDGGMPSGHSATVTAMAVRSLMVFGIGSFEFAVTCMLAIIVMHDARGVRQETGKQAKVIKDLASFLESMGRDITDEEKLKEFVGHTPLQVIAGSFIGILVALLLP